MTNIENIYGSIIHLVANDQSRKTLDYYPKGIYITEEFKGERKIDEINPQIILNGNICNHTYYLTKLSFKCNDGYLRECLVRDRFSNM